VQQVEQVGTGRGAVGCVVSPVVRPVSHRACEATCGCFLADALACDGITLSADEASYLTRSLLRLAELGALVASDGTRCGR
jgi:hypothetical protein